MAYFGRQPLAGEVVLLNQLTSPGVFNGTLTTFNLTRSINGVNQAFFPVSDQSLLVSLGGVIQQPDSSGSMGFTTNGSQITFAVAPLANTKCFIVSYGHVIDTNRPGDQSVTSEKIKPPGPTWDSAGSLSISGTGYIDIPAGTTAQRPGSANTGMLRFNTNFNRYEGYDGSSWGQLGGAGGSSGDGVFYENDTNVTASYTISTNKNAMSAGPITINNGVTVTVPTGSVWTVV
tara:strand:- start:2065 stop:2760 length:696 start_codon:yes stop_codon:yes gene_type:complete